MSDTNPRPSYFSQIRVDPNNDLKIWLGGVNIYMSEDGGKTFVADALPRRPQRRSRHLDRSRQFRPHPHPATMAASGSPGIAAATGSTSTTWRSASSTKSPSTSRSPITSAAACRTTTPGADPVPPRRPTGIGNEDWITVQGGDGFYNRIDPTDPNIIYAESQDGNLSRRDLRTSESKSIRPQEDNDTGAALPLPVELAADDFAARSQDHLLRRQSPLQIDRPRRHLDAAGRGSDHQRGPRQDDDPGQDDRTREHALAATTAWRRGRASPRSPNRP